MKNFGIIGLGVWGETHLKAYSSSPYANLAAICDKNEELLEQRQDEYDVPFATTDYTELLQRDDVDAVSVVVPDFLHCDIAVAACNSAKDVLLEKPMDTTVEGARSIADAADKNGVKLMVDFHNRWNPPFYKMKQAVQKGEIGEPQMMTLRLNDTIFVPTGMLSWVEQTTPVWFLGSHVVDLAQWLFDDDIARVYSVSRSRVLADRGINSPDFFHSICEFENGGVAHVENCWILSDAMPTVFEFKAELVGSEGTMYADPSTHQRTRQYSEKELQPVSSSPHVSYPDAAAVMEIHNKPAGFGIESILHFVDCVIADKQPAVTIEQGIANTAVLVAIHESAECGEPVDVTC